MLPVMPAVRQIPSPNYSQTLISHDLFVAHMTEGGYLGSVAWCCRQGGAAPHLFMSEDGAEVTQSVPLQFKAWAQCAFNACGVSLEIPGFTAQGVPEARWRAAALIAAWVCRAYAIPPVWAPGGVGRGLCQHHDLGAAGGGHVDCSGIGSPTWLAFVGYVKEAFDAFDDGPLPAFALHGAPAPHAVELPPDVAPEPSHGGAPRVGPGDVVAHATASGWPLASIGDWQWRLAKAGANPALKADDSEGAATRAAIGVFQKAVGLPVTNDVNAATWARLEAMTA